MLTRLLRWIKDFWRWLAEGKIIIMCILILVAVYLWVAVIYQSKDSIVYAGYVLQLIGMMFAIEGLLNIRKYFGQPPLTDLFVQWVKRFPKWNRNYVITLEPFRNKSTFGTIRPTGWWPDSDEKSIEERIEVIVKNLEIIRQEQSAHFWEVDRLKQSHEEHIKNVVDQHKKITADMYSEREAFHTGDLMTSLVGLGWITVGMTISSLAPEIYQWLYA